ncbi:MAG: DNA-3-methyladenine glycosylase 2 family protein [Clostridia bacterium]|nr:DNA-3-methyladenine glycosylase 2 family protein [Clostridia bacterium]
MKIKKLNKKIIVYDLKDFNIKQTLECGQIFRFNIEGNNAIVYSQDKMAKLTTYEDRIEIETKDVEYFVQFFDLDREYSEIKNVLRQDKMLKEAVDYGYGIRILNNDAYEMIISFIISANNNISRIKKSIEYLCSHFGKNMGEYHAFPTLEELKSASIEDFKRAGLGYRAEYMYGTVQRLTMCDIDNLKKMSTQNRFEYLLSLKGVGEKVANCIMLFGLGEKSVFPVDTWINKVYNDIYNKEETNRSKITKELTDKYKDLSGYAQQYFFYYYRDNKKK